MFKFELKKYKKIIFLQDFLIENDLKLNILERDKDSSFNYKYYANFEDDIYYTDFEGSTTRFSPVINGNGNTIEEVLEAVSEELSGQWLIIKKDNKEIFTQPMKIILK